MLQHAHVLPYFLWPSPTPGRRRNTLWSDVKRNQAGGTFREDYVAAFNAQSP